MRASKISPIWPYLASFPSVSPFGPVWPRKALFGPVWPRLATFDSVWHHLAPFCPVWPRLAPKKGQNLEFSRIWAHFCYLGMKILMIANFQTLRMLLWSIGIFDPLFPVLTPWAPKGGQNFEFPWICFQLRNSCMGCHIIANYQTLGMIIWGMVIFWPPSPVLTRGGGPKRGLRLEFSINLIVLIRVFDFQSSFAKKNAMGTHFTHRFRGGV